MEVCKNVPVCNVLFVFAYILDMTDEKLKMAEQTAKTLDCSVRYLTADKVKEEDTIEKWLANFRDAKYVITDSYHGTVFSLIFQKQFYTFYNNYRGNARMDSLKEISGLVNRFITKPVEVLGEKIWYNDVEERLERLREESEVYLSTNLK